jgi:septum formation protein
MDENDAQIYLASTSPRRLELLNQIGVRFSVLRLDIPEIPGSDEIPQEFAARLALEKATAGWRLIGSRKTLPVLGADTVVVLDNKIMGKPENREQGLAMLKALSGRSHQVITAVSIVQGEVRRVKSSASAVTFRATTHGQRAAYWSTGEPHDKAGAYAIQGLGAVFVTSLTGSYSGVVGLPLFETAALLEEFQIRIFP